MKILKKFDDSIEKSEISHNHLTGWVIPSDVQSVEFEDGTILINESFDLESVKATKISALESKVVDLQIKKDASVKAGLSGTSLQTQIDALKAEIATIEAL